MSKYNIFYEKSAVKSKGFTLIEIIITITIIGILSIIVGISLNGSQAKSRDSQRYSKVTVISEALEKYYQAEGSYPSCEELTTDPTKVTADILKGLGADTLTAPGSLQGTNSISCSDTTINSYYYNSDTAINGFGMAGRQYVLKYVEEATGDTEVVKSKYGIVLLESSTIHASATSDSQIKLDWTAVEGAMEYKLQRATDYQFKDNLFEETSKNLTSTHSGLTAGTKYYFRVVGQAMNASSDWSEIKDAITIVLPPSSTDPIVTANTVGPTTTWSWTTPTCAAGTVGYQYLYTNNGGYSSGWIGTAATSVAFSTPNPGYTFTVQVQARCSTVATSSAWSTPPGGASYRRPFTYTLTTAAGIGGSVSAGGSYLENTTATITATPNTGYTFTSWTGSTGCSGVVSHSITMDTNKSCTANFTINTYTVTLTASPAAGGVVTGGGVVNYGSSRTITATPNSGYSFSSWSGSAGCSGAASHSITITSNISCTASFTLNIVYLSVTLIANPVAGGSVSGGGSFASGSVRTITATPNSGYVFSSWSGSTGCSGSVSHTITVDANKTCTANFTVPSYTVSVSTVGGGFVGGGGTITSGASTTITASAWNGYTFSSWSGTGCSGAANHAITVTSNMACVANFTINSYTLTVTNGTGGTVSGGGTYTYGSTPTITATANSGYTFTSWSGSSGCSGVASHTITITGTLSCTATFTANVASYTLTVTPGTGGYVSGGGTYTSGSTPTITATANSGYSFASWSGSTGCAGIASHTITMNASKTCTATFTANVASTYNLTVTGGTGGTTSGSATSIAAGTSRQISASPSTGYTFTSWSANCSGTATHNVTVNSTMTCTASFTKNAVASKWVSKTVGPQSSSSFAATYAYNDGTYSGNISLVSTANNPTNNTLSKAARVDVGCGTSAGPYRGPLTQSYSDADGYSGTLNHGEEMRTACVKLNRSYWWYFSGTVYKTVTTNSYTGTYSGTVYGK